jgi:hypothetical protein
MSKLNDLVLNKTAPESIAEIGVIDSDVLEELLQGVSPQNSKENLRTNSHQALLIISEKQPEILYKKWEYFADLLKSEHSFSRTTGVYIITNLATIDKENRFDGISDDYFNLLNDEALPVAAHAARLFGRIALTKPKFEARITEKLLSIDLTNHTESHKSLMKAYIIEAFDYYFDKAGDKREITKFIKEQFKSKSLKAKKLASKFLKKYAIK